MGEERGGKRMIVELERAIDKFCAYFKICRSIQCMHWRWADNKVYYESTPRKDKDKFWEPLYMKPNQKYGFCGIGVEPKSIIIRWEEND